MPRFGIDRFQATDGAVATPGFTFLNDTDSGLYRIGANNWGMAVNGSLVASIGTGGLAINSLDVTGVRNVYFDGGGNHNIYANAALTDTARTLSISVLNSTADTWLAMITLTPNVADPTTDFGYGTRHYFTASVTAASQSLNTAPAANTITAANAASITAVGENLVISAITPIANGAGITLTGLNITQGAIANVADTEAITVTFIRMVGAAGAALETGIYTWTGIDITTPAQAANGAANVAAGLRITGSTQSAGGAQRGIDITMNNSVHNAIRVVTGRITAEGSIYYTSATSYLVAGANDASTVLFQAQNAAAGTQTVAQITTAAVVANSTFDLVNGRLTGTFVCNAQNMGTAGTMTINGLTLGGAVTGGSQDINNIDHLGLANQASDANYIITATETFDAPAASKRGLNTSITTTGSNGNNTHTGVAVTMSCQATNVGDTGSIFGCDFSIGLNSNTALATNVVGVVGRATKTAGTGAMTGWFRAVEARTWGNESAGAGAVTNAAGFYCAAPSVAGGGVTNAYGLYIEAVAGAATINRAIHLAAGGMWMSQIGSEPASAADLGGIYLIDVAASAVLGFHQETAVGATADIVVTHKWPIRINGATYYALLSNV